MRPKPASVLYYTKPASACGVSGSGSGSGSGAGAYVGAGAGVGVGGAGNSNDGDLPTRSLMTREEKRYANRKSNIPHNNYIHLN